VWRRSLLAWWRGCPQARLYAGLYALALLVRLALAWPVAGPSYFDAAYYQNAAESLIAGHGLTDHVIWNYLDDPDGLPRPSHLYWPPLNTWLAALGLLVNGWRGVQAVFIALSALLVPLAAYLAWSLWRRRDYAIAAGLLTLFADLLDGGARRPVADPTDLLALVMLPLAYLHGRRFVEKGPSDQ